jgi:hypothetical protein
MRSRAASLCILVTMSIALAGCKMHEQTGQDSAHPPKADPISAPATADPLTTKAIAKAMSDFASHWNGCPLSPGEMWYSKYTHDGKTYICEVKRPVPHPNVTELTEADKLNGVLWNGDIKFSVDAYRMYELEKKAWSDWEDPAGNGFWQMWIQNKHERWTFEHQGVGGLQIIQSDGSVIEWSASGDQVNQWKPIECSEVPKG